MSQERARAIRTLEDELLFFDEGVDSTTEKRNFLTHKAMEMATRIQVNDDDLKDPKVMAAAATVMGTAMKALNDTESSVTRRVNAKIKMVDQSRQDEMSGQVVELFKQMTTGASTASQVPEVDLDAEATKITEQLLKDGVKILPTELITDPTEGI